MEGLIEYFKYCLNGWVGTHRSNQLTSLNHKRFKRDIHGVKIMVFNEPGLSWPVVNLGLSLLILGLIVWYAFGANYLGSSSYREDVLRTRWAELTEENSALLSQKSSLANLKSLFAFVRRAGLAEYKNVEYLLDEKGLAQAEKSSY